jgi:hypothetical protein
MAGISVPSSRILARPVPMKRAEKFIGNVSWPIGPVNLDKRRAPAALKSSDASKASLDISRRTSCSMVSYKLE